MRVLKHIETGEIVEAMIVSISGNWLNAADGYTYDLRYWRVQ